MGERQMRWTQATSMTGQMPCHLAREYSQASRSLRLNGTRLRQRRMQKQHARPNEAGIVRTVGAWSKVAGPVVAGPAKRQVRVALAGATS